MDQAISKRFVTYKPQQTASVILHETLRLVKLLEAQLSDFIITGEAALVLHGLEKISSSISFVVEERFFNHILSRIRNQDIPSKEFWRIESNSRDQYDTVLLFINYMHDIRIWKKRSKNMLRNESLIFPNGLYVHPLTLVADELFVREQTPMRSNQLRAILKGNKGFDYDMIKKTLKETFHTLDIDPSKVTLDEEITKIFLGIKTEIGHIDIYLEKDEFLKLAYHPSVYRDDLNTVLVYGLLNFKPFQTVSKQNMVNLEGYKVFLPKFNSY